MVSSLGVCFYPPQPYSLTSYDGYPWGILISLIPREAGEQKNLSHVGYRQSTVRKQAGPVRVNERWGFLDTKQHLCRRHTAVVNTIQKEQKRLLASYTQRKSKKGRTHSHGHLSPNRNVNQEQGCERMGKFTSTPQMNWSLKPLRQTEVQALTEPKQMWTMK